MANTQGWEKALELLEPLNAQLDAALAAGDEQHALRLAFQGAAEAAQLVAESDGESYAGQANLHEVYVELTAAPLATYEDGTLGEDRTYVKLAYQRWQVAEEQIEQLAGDLLACGHGISPNWAVDSS